LDGLIFKRKKVKNDTYCSSTVTFSQISEADCLSGLHNRREQSKNRGPQLLKHAAKAFDAALMDSDAIEVEIGEAH
jgi:hypothetical protein